MRIARSSLTGFSRLGTLILPGGPVRQVIGHFWLEHLPWILEGPNGRMKGAANLRPVRSFSFLLWAAVTAVSSSQTHEEARFFESTIRPIFATQCVLCHGAKVQMADLHLTTREGFIKGTSRGPVIVRGDPAASRLIRAVGYQESIKMPPTGRLSDDAISALIEWVRMGAVWPNGDGSADQPLTSGKDGEPGPRQTGHWAFRPVADPSPPSVENQDWIQNTIDSFVLAKLEQEGLEPAPAADRLTLLRRAKFDLHGLPPSKWEVDEFDSDAEAGAVGRLID